MNTEAVQILWDASHLWGLMALAAMRGFGVPCGLISAKDIAHGCLFRKPPALLLIPGGNARQKARALGAAGRKAIRDWLEQGGAYLGFCGGAGLALEQAHPEDGLGICPWRRDSYADRQSHLVSGYLLADTIKGRLTLPVWWPGRFEPGAAGPDIMARYHAPTDEFWIGDIPLDNAAELTFPNGQPLVIRGRYGRGIYILSYAHLETPESPEANNWLAEIIQEQRINPGSRQTGKWLLPPELPELDGFFGSACRKLEEIFAYGEDLGLFFRRTSWLYGWRQGLPGMICNNLLAELSELGRMGINCQDMQLAHALEEFLDQAGGYFMSLPPADLVNPFKKEGCFAPSERDRIFGHAMLGGGLAGPLLMRLEELIIRNQERNRLSS